MNEFIPCDGGKGCRARSYVIARIGDSYLAFCAHHATRYWDRLSEVADEIIDHRDQLTRV